MEQGAEEDTTAARQNSRLLDAVRSEIGEEGPLAVALVHENGVGRFFKEIQRGVAPGEREEQKSEEQKTVQDEIARSGGHGQS